MICQRCCIFSASLPLRTLRTYATTTSTSSTTTARPSNSPPAALSTSAAQPFSNPLTPSPHQTSNHLKSTVSQLKAEQSSLSAQVDDKNRFVPPVSMIPEGGVLNGLNYMKGKEDPIALREDEYPEWLWSCLERKTRGAGDEAGSGGGGDEYAKSKKVRQAAAKRARKLEANLRSTGQFQTLEPKIPIQQQTIDLPMNLERTTTGALEAAVERDALRRAMRVERRKAIKTENYLKGFR